MEPENIDWDNIDSTFVLDDKYEDFEAPKWVDLSAHSDHLPVLDDNSWFCTQDCNHPKTAEDFLKPKTTPNSKYKLLRLASISELLPFRDRTCRGNYSATESFYAKFSEKPSGPIRCSRSFREQDTENKNPNFSGPIPKGSTKTSKKKPLVAKANKEDPKHLKGSIEVVPKRSERKPELKSTFSAQNLLGGREILSQISGFCTELKKRLAMKRRGSNEIGSSTTSSSIGSQEVKLKDTALQKERVPLLLVKEKWRTEQTLNANGTC